jgi:predicted dienelactone hydrolase
MLVRELDGPVVLSYREKSWVRAVVVIGALLCSWTAWAQYSPSSGPYHVLTAERIVLHDAARKKDLLLKIYYPDAPGPFPVIIFSHGALASKDCYSALGRYWASFGYVSIHPSHGDSIADSGFHGTLREAISDPSAWENRPKDVSFIIDSLSDIENLVPQLSGRLDRRHIGVGGHSFGAYTSELIGGTTILLPGNGKPQSFADKRVSAILLLSPQGEGRMGLTAHSWDKLHLPMLLMYGSLDFGPWGEAPVWRSEAFQKAPSGNKYEVEFDGGTHMGFAGASRPGGVQDGVFQRAKRESLAFWDAYLKHVPKAMEYLKSDGLKKFNPNAATFTNK